MATNNQQLTAQQRAQLFAAATRQHMQMLGTQKVSGGAQTVSFRVPKARLVQGVRLWVQGTINSKGASNVDLGMLDIYKVLRRVSIDYNNGFNPIVISGDEMAMVNMLYPNPEMVVPSVDGLTLAKCPAQLAATSGGADTAFEFMLDIPLTLNYRDMNGLVLAQNAETNIDINVDVANANAVIGAKSGYTCEYTDLQITPEITSFSIPSDNRAFPDLSVLKIVDSRNETFTSGQSYIKLPVGMIYRKLILKFENADGTPMTEEDITSNIELVLNTADVPYSVSPKMLKAINKMQAGTVYPDGCYYFSFDFQGVNGYGGSRDYIDAERISEFAVRFNTAVAGKLTIVSEKISRLIAG